MEHQVSSPGSITSSATVPDSESKPPTYTTAGTIYNPSTTQSLQPPTRRGRSFKWSSGGPNSDFALFPKTALASLPIGRFASGGSNSNTNPVGRLPAFQQYSPLQQNYDRAASPFYDPDHGLVKMQSETPRMRSGNTPGPQLSLFADKHQVKAAEGQTSDDEDEDNGDLAMDPLMSMPVKSLHNLASYPNPSQKKAQKALLRGTKPNLTGFSAAPDNNASSSPFLRSVDTADDSRDGYVMSSNLLRPAQSDPAGLRRDQEELWSGPSLSRTYTNRPSHLSSFNLVRKDESSGSELVSTTLSTGPGAPRPLTAGPPGQRQYRPSTFESTFKALTFAEEQQNLGRDEHGRSVASRGMQNDGLGGEKSMNLASPYPASMDMDPVGTRQAMAPWALPDDYLPPTQVSDRPRSVLGPVGTAAYTRIMIPAASQSPLSTSSDASWYHERCAQVASIANKGLAARNERVDSHWYAGADLLGKSISDHIDEAWHGKVENKYGAVGDGRPSKNKSQYRPLEMPTAERMSVAEHAEPLINMLFGTMLRHIQQQHDKYDYRSFGEPAPELIDESIEGRASFFGKPLEGKAARSGRGRRKRSSR